MYTDLPQKWGKPSSSAAQSNLYEPVPVRDFCHLPQRKKRTLWDRVVPETVLAAVKAIMYEGCKDSCMVRKSEEGRGTGARIPQNDNDEPEECDYVEDSFILPCLDELNHRCGDDSKFMNAMSSAELDFYLAFISVSMDDIKRIHAKSRGQGNYFWRKERQIRITGATAHKFKAQMNRNTTCESRCQSLILPKKPFRGNDATKYGNEHEPIALQLFAEKLPHYTVLTNFGFGVNLKMPAFGYSPDGIILETRELLEVKCLTLGKTLSSEAFCEQLTKKPKYLEKNACGSYALKKNNTFYTQIQFGLGVLNLEMGKVLLYYNNSTEEGVVAVDVPRDSDFIEPIFEALRNSYFAHILPFLVRNCNELLIKNDS